MSRVVEAVRQLAALTEEQVLVARALRGDELQELNSRRVDALFALRIALAEDGLPSQSPDLRQQVRRLTVAEQRLSAVAQTVLERVARIDLATPPAVYDRSGRLG